MNKFYTINEVTEKFKVSRQTVYRWFKSGLNKTIIGTVVRISEDDLNDFIEKEGK